MSTTARKNKRERRGRRKPTDRSRDERLAVYAKRRAARQRRPCIALIARHLRACSLPFVEGLQRALLVKLGVEERGLTPVSPPVEVPDGRAAEVPDTAAGATAGEDEKGTADEQEPATYAGLSELLHQPVGEWNIETLGEAALCDLTQARDVAAAGLTTMKALRFCETGDDDPEHNFEVVQQRAHAQLRDTLGRLDALAALLGTLFGAVRGGRTPIVQLSPESWAALPQLGGCVPEYLADYAALFTNVAWRHLASARDPGRIIAAFERAESAAWDRRRGVDRSPSRACYRFWPHTRPDGTPWDGAKKKGAAQPVKHGQRPKKRTPQARIVAAGGNGEKRTPAVAGVMR